MAKVVVIGEGYKDETVRVRYGVGVSIPVGWKPTLISTYGDISFVVFRHLSSRSKAALLGEIVRMVTE